MATAEAIKRPRKKIQPAAAVRENPQEEHSASFFMPASAMTLAGFRHWTYSDQFPQQGLIAFIGGEIFVDMSAERLTSQGSVKTAICATLAHMVLKKNLGKFYFDRSRIVHELADISNEPDALFASWDRFKTNKIRMIPTKDEEDFIELEGTPDWVMEIVSPSSITKDAKKLRQRYHLAGIPEYWLIDARGEDLKFEILVYAKEDYQSVESKAGWLQSKVFAKKFRLLRIKDPMGNWDYRLKMK